MSHLLIQEFKNLVEVDKNELYILGDFNINLLYEKTYILKENQSCKYKNLITPILNQYKEICQLLSLKQIIRSPTRITCNTSSVIVKCKTTFT